MAYATNPKRRMMADDEPEGPKPVEFPIPEGYKPPEGTEAGAKEFEQVCTLRIKPDGKTMCIVKVGDTPLPGYDEKEKKSPEREKRPDYSEMAQGITSDMQPKEGAMA